MVTLLILVASFLGAVVLSMYAGVRAMAASPELQPRPEWASEIEAAPPRDLAAFLAANHFQFVTAYGFHLVRLGIWTQKAGARPVRRFCLSRTSAGDTYEFSTDFSDDASLTTTRTRSAFVFPRTAGGFMQSFPKMTIEQLWEAHVRGEQFLISQTSIPVRECRLSFPERERMAMSQQLASIRSKSLWPLRGAYWYLVKRFLMHNRPIWEQDLARPMNRFLALIANDTHRTRRTNLLRFGHRGRG